MNRLFFGIIYLFSLLPTRILYGFSWIIYLVLNYLIGYRRKVIFDNLKNSFPDKSIKEIKLIQKQFYKNFADYLVETLKSFSISDEELERRHTFSNTEIIDQCNAEGKDVILMAGHIFNWEWLKVLVKYVKTKHTVAVYHKIKNKFWDEQINSNRGKYGTLPIDMKDTGRYIMATKGNGDHAYLFIADQSPKKSALKESIQFLNQETPVFVGFDKIAIKKNMAVVFCRTVKIKQGHYHTTFERIEPNAEKFQEMEVVEKFFKRLEETIEKDPANWLWSHKRWKFKKGIDY